MGFFDRFRKTPQSREAGEPIASLSFVSARDFEIASCPGKHALQLWEKAREEGRKDGLTVVILGDSHDVETLAKDREYANRAPSDILRIATNINIEEWLKQRFETDPEHYAGELGDWPRQIPDPPSISAHYNSYLNKPKSTVYIARIPTPRNWEIPACLGMGGWHECPEPAVHVAMAKSWQERYGAEIVSITHDVIEFEVARPADSREAALTLAKEHFLFCPDIVDQGGGTISYLAATLLNSKYWYFWWD